MDLIGPQDNQIHLCLLLFFSDGCFEKDHIIQPKMVRSQAPNRVGILRISIDQQRQVLPSPLLRQLRGRLLLSVPAVHGAAQGQEQLQEPLFLGHPLGPPKKQTCPKIDLKKKKKKIRENYAKNFGFLIQKKSLGLGSTQNFGELKDLVMLFEVRDFEEVDIFSNRQTLGD